MLVMMFLIIQAFTIPVDEFYDVKLFMIKQVVWKNDEEILLVQTRHLGRKGSYEGYRDNFSNNQRVLHYDIKEKKLIPLYNKDFGKVNKYILGRNGKRVLCLNFTDSNIIIYKDRKEIYKTSIKDLKLDKIFGIHYIDEHFAYLYYYVQHGEQKIVKLDYISGKYIIPDKEVHLIPQRIILSKPDKVIFSDSTYKILCLEPGTNSFKEIYSINKKWKYWGDIGIISNTLYFQAKKPGESAGLFIYDIQAKKLRKFPFDQKYSMVFVSNKYLIFVKKEEDEASNKKSAEYLLFNHKGKLKWRKKLCFKETDFPFPTISKSENKMGFWTLSGKIQVYEIQNIPALKKSKQKGSVTNEV